MPFAKLFISSALAICIAAASAPAAEEKKPSRTFGSTGIIAEAVSASASKKASNLVVTVVLTNTSTVAKQLYIADDPTVVDNRGHSFSANRNMNGVIGGLYICEDNARCLDSQKTQTENNATIVDPNTSVTLTIAFNYPAGADTEVGDEVSVGLLIHVRSDSAEGDPGAKWKTVSLGVPNISLRGA
ncbi:hypothetical protein FZ934_25490 (plasmid) [Rhizobium grahamii]|uniref:DUF4352 domain-containing protein n=1 Tax=Rhizobium grahamii TaxID=1120045 RepID=A0A5Q0CE77_9HYPH|nr:MULTISPECIES: hypothetical protein [Rhizobium]QFY63595.1 hypothetical protein FZ934_25490 [Rhizobium grahamii]QRM51641.1 hypothetical protein F3Y33_20155 [Rhizobium sp. BG6]